MLEKGFSLNHVDSPIRISPVRYPILRMFCY